VLQKLFRRVHRGYYSLFLTPRTPLSEYRTNRSEQVAPLEYLLRKKGRFSASTRAAWMEKRTAPVSPFEQNKNSG
jgi:hypothetical protein